MTDARPTAGPTGAPRSCGDAPRCSIAIFTSREPIHVLLRSLRATIAAADDFDAVIDVLVNGNRKLADELAGHLESLRALSAALALRVWFIPLGDKAHAWNEYLTRIWTPGTLALFVDGYVEPDAGAFRALRDALSDAPEALAASGVPTAGRSATRMRSEMSREGGIHGNLYALRASTMDALKARGFRLPLGIYRTDPLLGAVLAFNLDPRINAWNVQRIRVVPQASWSFEPLKLLRPKDLATHLRRILRQAQGVMENRAIRRHLAILQRAPEDLPGTAASLVSQWIIESRDESVHVFCRHPLSLLALKRMRKPRDWSTAVQLPSLVAQTRPVHPC